MRWRLTGGEAHGGIVPVRQRGTYRVATRLSGGPCPADRSFVEVDATVGRQAFIWADTVSIAVMNSSTIS
jgi:hypothetical protein